MRTEWSSDGWTPRPHRAARRLRSGANVLHVDLVTSPWGVSFRVFLNTTFAYSERFPTVEQAHEAAERYCAGCECEGWRNDVHPDQPPAAGA